MHRMFGALAAMLIAAPALAQEPVGCDKFKFNLDQERVLLDGGDMANVKTGDTVPLSRALSVALLPFASAGCRSRRNARRNRRRRSPASCVSQLCRNPVRTK